MEKQRAAARWKNKPAQQPVKVVYISSPVRVTAAPAEFRDLVQKFTGSGSSAAAAAAATGFINYASPATDDELGSAGSSSEEESGGFCSPTVAPAARLLRVRGCDVELENSLVAPVEVFDEAAAFDVAMWENFYSNLSFYPLHLK